MKKIRGFSGLILLSSLLVTLTACSGGGDTKKRMRRKIQPKHQKLK